MVVIERPVKREICMRSCGLRSDIMYLPSPVCRKLEANCACKISRCWGFQLDCRPFRFWAGEISSASSGIDPSISERSERLVGVEDLDAWLSVRLRSISEMSDRAFSRRGELEMKEATADEAFPMVMVDDGEIEVGVEVEEDRAADPMELLLSLLPLVRSIGWSLLMW